MMAPEEMRTTAEELLGQDRVLEMRMWGPTEELMRNSFQQENNTAAPANSDVNSTARSAAVELTQVRPTTVMAREQSA